jgi:hypothetical protein
MKYIFIFILLLSITNFSLVQNAFSVDSSALKNITSIGLVGSNNQTISKNATKIYHVHINQPNELKIDAERDSYNLLLSDTLALGDDIKVHGGIGNYKYKWVSTSYQNINNIKTIKVSPIDTTKYTLIVEDDGGCSTTSTFTVNVIEPILVDATIKNIECFGNTNGEIQLGIHYGAPPYSILWETGVTTTTRSGLSAGLYKVNVSDQMGQVVIKEISITEKSKIERSIDASICGNDYFSVGNTTYNKTGYYSDTLIAKNGCDSIIHLYLQINTVYENTLDASICAGGSYHFGNRDLNESGEYKNIVTSNMGCDSLIKLNLTVNPIYSDTIKAILCEGDSSYFDHDYFKNQGIYHEIHSSSLGCDSSLVLDLRITPIPEKPIIEVVGDTLKTNLVNVQWYSEGFEIEGANYPNYIIDHSGSYFVKAICENNCFSFSDTLFINLLNNYQYNDNHSYKIYPNPNSGEFNIAINSKSKTISIEFYTDDGKYLFSQLVNNENEKSIIPVSFNRNLKGNFLLTIKDGIKNYSQKITIK